MQTYSKEHPFGTLETTSPRSAEEIEKLAADLLSRLTLDEKIQMMSGDLPFWKGMAEMMGRGYNSRPWPAGQVDRLGIPGIQFSDGPRGNVMKGATTFPVSMARGATWDIELEERVGDVIGKELRAMGANFFGGICINLLRHPAWGRAQETYGEDSFLLGAFGAALTRGVQRHVMACAKHYALNSMENARFTVDVQVDPRSLNEVYLAHFKCTVEAGVASIMSSYNSVNGEWCGQNKVLLQDILKDEWGFDGFVMTDFMFGMRDSKTAALAGQDVEMPFATIHNRSLKKLVEEGEVPLSRIDDAALRVLRQLVRFASGRDPKLYTPAVVGSAENIQLAREAALKSIVMLKNKRHILPLKKSASIAVIGKLAATANTGDRGSSNTEPAYVVTPLEGIKRAFGKTKVKYNDGSALEKAAKVAADAEAAIVLVGYTSMDEGEYVMPDITKQFAHHFPEPTEEDMPLAANLFQIQQQGQTGMKFAPGGDRASLRLKPADEELILKVAAANPNTIVIIETGSAVILEKWKTKVPAILVLWYPGMEGGNALADILNGTASPQGRLPCTFPRRMKDLPYFDRDAKKITYDMWHGYRKLERDSQHAAFPFGFGLTYTRFEWSDIRVTPAIATAGDTFEVSVRVRNRGKIAAADVVQLYVGAPDSKVERAVAELKGFQRVELQPGEEKRVSLSLPVRSLEYYDPKKKWTVEKTRYVIMLRRHAEDSQGLEKSVRVT